MATPKTSQPIFTKFGTRDSVTDIYTCAKFHDDQSRYLVTMYMKLCEPYFFYIFGGFLQLHSQGPSPIFAHNTSYDAVPRKNVLLRGQKIKN